ncbi:F-box protein [Streptomyces sp. NPDC087903]|uniref:F-box protein n=1 Tax=Streptomyces sp. NPDC087903 TaxID=3365819 RepID=UPI0037F9776E
MPPPLARLSRLSRPACSAVSSRWATAIRSSRRLPHRDHLTAIASPRLPHRDCLADSPKIGESVADAPRP